MNHITIAPLTIHIDAMTLGYRVYAMRRGVRVDIGFAESEADAFALARGYEDAVLHYGVKALLYENTAHTGRDRILHAVMGLMNELGEALGPLKKALFRNAPLDEAAMRDELGDVLWYLNLLARALGMTLDDIAQRNLEKLYARWPNGYPHQKETV